MDWREKLAWGALCLVLIGWGLVILGAWPVLSTHLTTGNWIVIALLHAAVLLGLAGLYANTHKSTPSRSRFCR